MARAIRKNGGAIPSNVSNKNLQLAYKAAFGKKMPPLGDFTSCKISVPYPGGNGSYISNLEK